MIAEFQPRTMRGGLRTPRQFMDNHLLKSKVNCGPEIQKNNKHKLRQSEKGGLVLFLKPNRNFAKHFKMPTLWLILAVNWTRTSEEKRGKMYQEQSCRMQTSSSSLQIPK